MNNRGNFSAPTKLAILCSAGSESTMVRDPSIGEVSSLTSHLPFSSPPGGLATDCGFGFGASAVSVPAVSMAYEDLLGDAFTLEGHQRLRRGVEIRWAALDRQQDRAFGQTCLDHANDIRIRQRLRLRFLWGHTGKNEKEPKAPCCALHRFTSCDSLRRGFG